MPPTINARVWRYAPKLLGGMSIKTVTVAVGVYVSGGVDLSYQDLGLDECDTVCPGGTNTAGTGYQFIYDHEAKTLVVKTSAGVEVGNGVDLSAVEVRLHCTGVVTGSVGGA